MDYIKKVINGISCLITDTVMTEQEGSRRCITTEDLNEFEEWITWLEKASEGNQANSKPANCAIFDVSGSLPSDEFENELKRLINAWQAGYDKIPDGEKSAARWVARQLFNRYDLVKRQ